jgi:hypothetical protein
MTDDWFQWLKDRGPMVGGGLKHRSASAFMSLGQGARDCIPLTRGVSSIAVNQEFQDEEVV